MSEEMKIEILAGVEGNALLIDGYRVAGPKAWGSGTVTKSFNVKRDEIFTALNTRLSPWIEIESDGSNLPKEGTEILIVTDYGLRATVTYRDGQFVRLLSCRRCDGMSLGSVIAYMPIPELPLGE